MVCVLHLEQSFTYCIAQSKMSTTKYLSLKSYTLYQLCLSRYQHQLTLRFAVITQCLDLLVVHLPASSIDHIRPLFRQQHIPRRPTTSAYLTVHVHREVAVAVREHQQLGLKCGVVVQLEPMRALCMPGVPLELSAHVHHQRTRRVDRNFLRDRRYCRRFI